MICTDPAGDTRSVPVEITQVRIVVGVRVGV